MFNKNSSLRMASVLVYVGTIYIAMAIYDLVAVTLPRLTTNDDLSASVCNGTYRQILELQATMCSLMNRHKLRLRLCSLIAQ